jgi:hypothetical protein
MIAFTAIPSKGSHDLYFKMQARQLLKGLSVHHRGDRDQIARTLMLDRGELQDRLSEIAATADQYQDDIDTRAIQLLIEIALNPPRTFEPIPMIAKSIFDHDEAGGC